MQPQSARRVLNLLSVRPLPESLEEGTRDMMTLLPLVAPNLPTAKIQQRIALAQERPESNGPLPGLQKAVQVVRDSIPAYDFFGAALPKIFAAAKSVPVLFPEGSLEILPKNKSPSAVPTHASLSLTRKQVNALLAASFFDRLPYVDADTFGSVGWLNLMLMGHPVGTHRIACLLAYFHTYGTPAPGDKEGDEGDAAIGNREDEVVTFERVSGNFPMTMQDLLLMTTIPVIHRDTPGGAPFIRFMADTRIEDVPEADAIVDFANKQPSIGEIIPSATQEEVLFSIKPEAMLAMVLFEELEPAEVGIVHGSQRYSNYTGYMDTFRFHSAPSPVADGDGCPAAMIVMDAMVNRAKAEFRDAGFERDRKSVV